MGMTAREGADPVPHFRITVAFLGIDVEETSIAMAVCSIRKIGEMLRVILTLVIPGNTLCVRLVFAQLLCPGKR